MNISVRGFRKIVTARSLPNGNVIVSESFKYLPDSETEIESNTELRDLTDKELNEIMFELENGKVLINDNYPLKGIREKALL